MKPATIYDVARLAEVSAMTVSRYLRGTANVRAATASRIQGALTELDYRPNSAARLLRGQRLNRIAVLVHALGETGPSRTLAGIATAAREHGFVLDVIDIDGNDLGSVQDALGVANENQVAGLIATAQTESVLKALEAAVSATPKVTEVTVTPLGYEMTHDAAIGALAADHLANLGFTTAAYLAGPTTWTAAIRRREGFHRRWVSRTGNPPEPVSGDWSAASGYDAAHQLLHEYPDVKAVACGNDAMAIGVLAALSDRRITVPDEFSVIGADDVPEAQFHRPSLSTIALDFEGEGRALVEQLLLQVGLVETRDFSPVRPPHLVARGTTRQQQNRCDLPSTPQALAN